jgi:hypothetical protein
MNARTLSVDVIRIPTKGPGDVSGLMALIESGKLLPAAGAGNLAGREM